MSQSGSGVGSIAAKKFKLVLLGESGVGKSACVVRLCKDEYVQSLHSTVGSSFFKYSVNLDDTPPPAAGASSSSSPEGSSSSSSPGQPQQQPHQQQSSSSSGSVIHFDIWDTAGQERFSSLARMYYRGAAAILVVYDITSIETFERAKLWVKELNAQQESAVITLVGNKIDLDDERAVPREEAAAFASERGIDHYEASAKTGQGIKYIFHQIATKLAKNANATTVATGGVKTSGGVAAKPKAPEEKKSCPC